MCLFVSGLPECHKSMLVGIVVQRFTGRENSKIEPPVHGPNRRPVPEIVQVYVTAAINKATLTAVVAFIHSSSISTPHVPLSSSHIFHFYSASALLAMQSAVLARGILSVRHIPVLCPDE